jgi:hypothetical protein
MYISMSPNNIFTKTNGTCKSDTYSDLFAFDIQKNNITEI